MKDLLEQIKKLKPNLKETSIKTYIAGMKKICKGLDLDHDNCDDIDFLKKREKVVEFLDTLPKTTKKNLYIAIVVSLQAQDDKDEKLIEFYTEHMTTLANEYEEYIKTQQKSEKQKENWIDYDEMVEILNRLLDRIKDKQIHKKDVLDRNEYKLFQQYILLRTYLDIPIRNDFSDMKVIEEKEYDEKYREKHKGNWLILKNGNPKEFILHDYKTSGKYGMREIPINKSLSKMIKRWLNVNTSGFFITKLNDKTASITPNGITKLLQDLFKRETNKNISTSMIRHIVSSHIHRNSKTILEEEKEDREIENKFLHSKAMNKKYAKY
jgi:hypothetical protein